MANRAALLDAEVRQARPGATVKRRGRNFIEHDLGGGVTRWTGTLDPLHTRAGAEIDTTWVADESPWSYRIAAADYVARAKAAFNGAPLVQYTDIATGAWVTLQPQQLNWTNDSNSVQMISAVQGVTAELADDLVRWPGAYGAGRDFEYVNHPRRLIKRLVLQSALPTPSAAILGGANPALQLQFIFDWSSDATVWVDGAQWDRKTAKATASRIEFRVAGVPIFRFDPPAACGADGEVAPGVVMKLRKAGNNLYVEVRTPYAWLQGATYPVVVDPTLTLDEGESGIDVDTYLYSGSATTNYGTNTQIRFDNSGGCSGIFGIDLSSIPAGSKCNSAAFYVTTSTNPSTSSTNVSMYALREANFDWTEAGATWNTKDGTDAWAGDPGCTDGIADIYSTAIGTGLLLGSFGGGEVGSVTELTVDTSEAAARFGSTLHFRFNSAGTTDYYIASSDHGTASYRPKIVIDYTTSTRPWFAYAQQ